MDSKRLRTCLADDAARLREVAAADLRAPVPTCPEWTIEDLLRHVAVVYLHKVECMRLGTLPRPWPPDTSGEHPVALFDRAYLALVAEFADRSPRSPAATWYQPDQTVGFWIRRMAHETLIHRIDAELARRATAAPVPDDLAEDGVDEVLTLMLGYLSHAWREQLETELAGCDGRPVLVSAGGRGWLVRATSEGVDVADAAAAADGGEPSASVSGTPAAMLAWLWRRSDDAAVEAGGDRALIAQLTRLLGAVTT